MADLAKLNSEINDWTDCYGIENFSGPNRSEQQKNAFAHAYASAHITYDDGKLVSNALGAGREYRSLITDTFKALSGAEGYSVEGVWRDGHRDMFNNHVGNAIADYALKNGLPKEAIGHLVADAVRTGQLITNEFVDPRVSAMSFATPRYTGPSAAARAAIEREFGIALPEECFSATAMIQVGTTETKLISDLGIGDTILTFDPAADLGRGALVPRKVVRLYRNTTTEWIKLTWTEGGDHRELVATPGHHFLDRFGSFPTIEEMIEAGRATVVLASGELTEVSAERIVYSAETAHLFERAKAQGVIAGNTALKPIELDAWQTYNFEVEELHTYVAGGVRVHNDSGLLGEIGNAFDAALDTLFGAKPHGFIDTLTDIATAPFHIAGNALGLAVDVFQLGVRAGDYFLDKTLGAALSKVAGPLNSVAGVIGEVLDFVLGPIGNWLDGIFHPYGYNKSEPEARDPRAHPGPHAGSKDNFEKADKDHDGHLDDNEHRDFRDMEEERFDRQRAEEKATKPILLDLNRNGIEITELSQSTRFADAGNDGLLHRTAWAGVGDAVLFFDPDGRNAITETQQYVFTEWDPTAGSDIEALRSVFDTNGDGKLTAADADFAKFKYLHAWETGSQAKAGIGRWIAFYNHHRPHTAHGGQPPAVVYFNATQTDQQVQAVA